MKRSGFSTGPCDCTFSQWIYTPTTRRFKGKQPTSFDVISLFANFCDPPPVPAFCKKQVLLSFKDSSAGINPESYPHFLCFRVFGRILQHWASGKLPSGANRMVKWPLRFMLP